MPFFKRRRNEKKSSGVFVNNGDHYDELVDEVTKESINAITEFLGYNIDQVHTIHAFDDKDLEVVVVEVFSNKVVYVITDKKVTNLHKKRIDKFLKSVDWGMEYDRFRVEEILDVGIENQSLTSEYLSKVLEIENSKDGMLFVEKLGLYLVFADGYLIDYQSADGLNKSAKLLKDLNFKLLENYYRETKKYHKNDYDGLMNEINTQADCFTATPDAYSNKFIQSHKSEFGNVNFYNLMVAHYGKVIDIEEFKEINKGRYTESIGSNSTSLYVGSFEYEFDSEGKIMDIKENRT